MFLITRKSRYFPVIEWKRGHWVHNIFRVYEMIFGREYGVRPEMHYSGTFRNGTLTSTYQFFTVEAFLAHVEGRIREFFKKPQFEFKLVPFPVLATTVGMQKPIFTYAIAFGAYEGKEGTGTSVASDSITVSGSDINGAVTIWAADNRTISSAEWNGSGLTGLTSSPQTNGGPSNVYGYWKSAPTTGTITGTVSVSANWSVVCAYYTGCNTSALDAQTVFANASTMSLTSALTTVDAGAWAIMMGRDNFGTTVTPSTNCTSRGEESQGTFLYDSNGTTGGGSYSQTVTDTNSAYISGFQLSFYPTGGGGPANLKSYNTNLKANIKSMNTNLIANVKSLNTNV